MTVQTTKTCKAACHTTRYYSPPLAWSSALIQVANRSKSSPWRARHIGQWCSIGVTDILGLLWYLHIIQQHMQPYRNTQCHISINYLAYLRFVLQHSVFTFHKSSCRYQWFIISFYLPWRYHMKLCKRALPRSFTGTPDLLAKQHYS